MTEISKMISILLLVLGLLLTVRSVRMLDPVMLEDLELELEHHFVNIAHTNCT